MAIEDLRAEAQELMDSSRAEAKDNPEWQNKMDKVENFFTNLCDAIETSQLKTEKSNATADPLKNREGQ